jgi:hypothetical protein
MQGLLWVHGGTWIGAWGAHDNTGVQDGLGLDHKLAALIGSS